MSEVKMSLIEITKDLLNALEEDEPSLEHLKESLMQAHENKVTNYCNFLSRLDNEREYLKKEMDHLKNQVKKLDKLEERLDDIVKYVCETLGTKKLEGTNGHYLKITVNDVVEIQDESLIPSEFQTVVTKVRPIDVKKALLDGRDVPGAALKKSVTVQKK
jgi:predicted small metal-binding protein